MHVKLVIHLLKQNYTVQKAQTYSHGRNFTAWFAVDLPFPFGPRRLHGLPGLILEAYDDRHQVVYTLGYIRMNPTQQFIGIPVKSETATLNQYQNMAQAWKDNYGKGNIQIDGKNWTATHFTDTPLPKKDQKSIYNNPIDLQN